MSHRARIAALERRLAPTNAKPLLIRITGGLPDADPMRTTVGYQELEREADETLRTFEARVLAAARAVGEKVVVLGGLPDR
jgi:hypothetical protein